MLIIGINDAHNAAAALVRDGKLVSALQEERLTRKKNWQGFPIQSIQVQLRAIGAGLGDVDVFVLNGTEFYPIPGGQRDRDEMVRAPKMNLSPWGRSKMVLRRSPSIRAAVMRRRNEERRAAIVAQGIPASKLLHMDHHRCHAATAYYGKGPDPGALIVTLDGAGDNLCATVSVTDDRGRLERLCAIGEEHSIGTLWAIITSLQGMVPLEHEYKMMGMAPYASGGRVREAADIFARAFPLGPDGTWRRAAGMPEANYCYEYWRDALEFVRFDYVMGGLQLFTEEIVSRWVQHWLRVTGKRRVRLSGGVFMNVKANKVVMELPEVEDLYVFPSCGDETNAIGAVWAYLEDAGAGETIEPMGPFYLGLEPTADEYDAAAALARGRGYGVERPADIEEKVAELLAAGEVVARHNGREEFGARALGNRSILADPSRRDVVKLINRAIKSRDFWMPFAASVLEEVQDRYLTNPKKVAAPYMILTFDSRNTDEVIAGCHPEDRTIRPQIVSESWNPSYHKLLRAFERRTGRGAVLNTSFNLHGEPIVSKPAEAIDVMDRSGLTRLAVGPYLVSKPAGTAE